MNPIAPKVNNQVHSVTVDTSIVSIREPLNYPLAVRTVTSFQKSLWPLVVIAIAALASVFWTFVLFWLIGRAVLY
jgi:hypothetical protein